MTSQNFLTIKEAAQQYNRSEQTIRRLVKQHKMTSHVRSEEGPKGKTYQISQALLQQEYEAASLDALPVVLEPSSLQEENQRLQEALIERDRVIQQLKNRLFEQADKINALTNQMTSQKIGHIEELLLKQSAQLSELQEQLVATKESEKSPDRRNIWQRLFKRS